MIQENNASHANGESGKPFPPPKRPARGLYKEGERWGIEYYCHGRRIRKMIGTSKKVALDVLQKRRVEIAENRHLDVKKEKKAKLFELIADYTRLHAQGKKSFKSSFEVSLKTIAAFFGNVYLRDITVKHIEEYRDAQKKAGLSDGTINRRMACLKGMFNKAIAWDLADTNPVKKVKFKKETNQRIRYLEEAELTKLLENSSPRLQAIIKFAVNTGMRKGEIQKMKWQDVDIEKNMITIPETKNGYIRYVPINQTVRDVLISVPKHKDSPFVFGDKRTGKPYNFRKAFQTALENSEITDFRFHDLRHTFASYLAMRGVDLNTIRELLGHRSIAMTLRYSHLSKDHKMRAVTVLDAIHAIAAAVFETKRGRKKKSKEAPDLSPRP